MATESLYKNLCQLKINTNEGKTIKRSYQIKEGATADDIWQFACDVAQVLDGAIVEVYHKRYTSVWG